MNFIDTHCHIQFKDFPIPVEEAIKNAIKEDVKTFIAVGCALEDSEDAVKLAQANGKVYASIGLHPHDGAMYSNDEKALKRFRELAAEKRVVAIGETGLDYHYMNSPKEDQKKMLRFQLDLAAEFNLPVILHVRDAFEDFWPIWDEYKDLKGVVHSFSSSIEDAKEAIKRGLYIGLNGIMTFTRNSDQLEAAKYIPLDRLLLETDAPFLTPAPYRGKICEPKYVRTTGVFLAELRGETLEDLAEASTRNAKELFKLDDLRS